MGDVNGRRDTRGWVRETDILAEKTGMNRKTSVLDVCSALVDLRGIWREHMLQSDRT